MDDTVKLICEAYLKIKGGMKRVDMETKDGVAIKAYHAGTIIRIDIKEED